MELFVVPQAGLGKKSRFYPVYFGEHKTVGTTDVPRPANFREIVPPWSRLEPEAYGRQAALFPGKIT
jgi:hypothetical protein